MLGNTHSLPTAMKNISKDDLKELKKELLLQFTYEHSLLIKRIEILEKKLKEKTKKQFPYPSEK